MVYKGETFGGCMESCLDGQASAQERLYMYNLVKEIKPSLTMECGTWKGGGSPFAIHKALTEINNGIFHTFEVNQEFYESAVNKFPKKCKFIKLHLQSFVDYVSKMESESVDFVLVDSIDDPVLNKQVLIETFRVLKPSGHILIHDFGDYENIEINETELLTDYLKNKFGFVNYLENTTGLMHCIKK
jgi:predicted O-methyltransferase YrrM